MKKSYVVSVLHSRAHDGCCDLPSFLPKSPTTSGIWIDLKLISYKFKRSLRDGVSF